LRLRSSRSLRLRPLHNKPSAAESSEIFNIFNRLNLGNPDTSFSGGGLIGGTRHGGDAPGIGYGEPRNIQFVLKFSF